MRISTDSLKTGLVILQTVNIKAVSVKNAIELIEDLLEARKIIEDSTKSSSIVQGDR